MRYFPVYLDLDGREVLIVGGGEKALQKLRLLTKTNARLRVVAEEIGDDIVSLARERPVALEWHRFKPSDLADVVMVFAAQDDADNDAEVAAAAKARGIPLNVVDGPGQSTFIMPAIVDRDPVVVAIGT
ncbi:MAG: bifunctional precorrin-2 dehydrogenase/sirohydrochlorin ferrochelatase, partial [Hyphomicrobium sp.]